MDDENLNGSPPEMAISVRDLRVSYGEREILHGITFDVMRGETLVILGGSGSGKSTLLRTLVGLEKPTSGHIWIQGKDIATISSKELDQIRKKTGMSFRGSPVWLNDSRRERSSASPGAHTTRGFHNRNYVAAQAGAGWPGRV